MSKDFDVLKDWLQEYIKNKDAFTKNIKEIKEGPNSFLVIHTDKEIHYKIIPEGATAKELEDLLKEKYVVLVFLNTKENFETIMQIWDLFKEKQGLTLIFANPHSSLEKKWIIHPYTHDKITEKQALKRGLKTLFKTVDLYR